MRSALRTLDAFARTTESRRLAIARDVCAELGEGFRSLDELLGESRVPAVVHEPTKVTLAIVPGGSFDMGLTDADLEELSEHVDWTGAVATEVKGKMKECRPVHRVRVAPFLCGVTLLSRSDIRRLSGGAHRNETLTRKDAIAFVASLGFRLPSEAELEWLARGGVAAAFTSDCARAWSEGDWPPVSRFGIESLVEGEWAADDWHPSYVGAPSTSEAWLGGDPCGVFRGELPIGPDQSRSELLGGLSSHRGRGVRPNERGSDFAFFRARLALSLS